MSEPEATLDPAEWEAFRALAHRMVDDTPDAVERIGREVAAGGGGIDG